MIDSSDIFTHYVVYPHPGYVMTVYSDTISRSLKPWNQFLMLTYLIQYSAAWQVDETWNFRNVFNGITTFMTTKVSIIIYHVIFVHFAFHRLSTRIVDVWIWYIVSLEQYVFEALFMMQVQLKDDGSRCSCNTWLTYLFSCDAFISIQWNMSITTT